MGSMISAASVLLGAAGLTLTWVQLKPSERRLAKRISLRAWRVASASAMLAFFLWSNYQFLFAAGPMTRFQVIVLLVVYAEATALAVLFLLGLLLDRVLSVEERVKNVQGETTQLSA